MADGLHYTPPGEADSGESDSSVSPEFKAAVEKAFPDDDWDDERLAAFKEAIHICYDEAELKEGDDGDEPKSADHASTLALLFGKPKGK